MGKVLRLLSLLMLGLLISAPAFAARSGAFRLEMINAEASGKGNAFSAEADNPSAVYFNPAGTTQIKGAQASVGTALFKAFIEAEPSASSAPRDAQMDGETFVIPSAFFVSDFGLERWKFGVGSYSQFGLGTSWHNNGFSRYVATNNSIEDVTGTVTAAYQVTEKLSLGTAVDLEYSKVSLCKNIYQTSYDMQVQVKGKDTGYGYRLSGLYKLNNQHQFGMQYRSPIDLQYQGFIRLHNISTDAVAGLGGASYRDVFLGENFTAQLSTKLTLPQSIVLGYSFQPNEKWRFNFDVEWMDWSAFEHQDYAYKDLSGTQLAVLDTGNPASKDWNDGFVFAVGAEYALNDQLRLRGGYFFTETPIPDANFDPSLPDSDSHNLSFGVGMDLTQKWTLDLSYTAMLFQDRDVDSAVGDGVGPYNNMIDGEYKNYSHFGIATLTYKF